MVIKKFSSVKFGKKLKKKNNLEEIIDSKILSVHAVVSEKPKDNALKKSIDSMKAQTYANNYVCIYFNNENQVDEFLQLIDLPNDSLFIDGVYLCRKLNFQLKAESVYKGALKKDRTWNDLARR